MSETKKSESLRWFEPRWSHVPRLKSEWSSLLHLKMWLRVSTVVILLTALTAYGVKHAVPDLDFNWAGALAASVGAFALVMFLTSAVLWAIPPIIIINCRGVCPQGQPAYRRLRADIRFITVDATDRTRPLLRVETSRKLLEIGIAPKITLPELLAFLKATFPEVVVTEKR
jgi:hypothetical protein